MSPWRGTRSRAGRCAGMLLSAALGLLVLAPGSQAEVTGVFDGDLSCGVGSGDVRICGGDDPRSTTPTFDGVPIDVNVALPPEPASGPDGDFPLIMGFHGYNGEKFGVDWMTAWAQRGYAVFTMTDRGFWESCGSDASRAADPSGCAPGFIRLMDTRYEVRDAQYLAGRLVDEGLVAPTQIGAWGGSYGGGMSTALAALRDRTMLPDGSLVPWESPDGTPMELAAALPWIGWTDLAAALLQNGSTLDYVADSPYTGRPGVVLDSVFNGLVVGVCSYQYCVPPNTDPEADFPGWLETLHAGEPYDANPDVAYMIDQLQRYHSAYYIAPDRPPAPTLITSGFTDDWLPPLEAIRFYNRTRSLFPGSPISLFLGDTGHPRAQNAGGDVIAALTFAWADHYIKGTGPEPFQGVTAMPQVCSPLRGDVIRAPDPAHLVSGEVRLSSAAAKVIAPNGGGAFATNAFSPNTPGAACNRVSAADQAGVASYRFPAAAGDDGYTLLGAPTVIADVSLASPSSQLDARLLDVAPDGTENLVTRGIWRPAAGSSNDRVLQLQPNGWTFAPGHVAKLELIPNEAPFWRASDGQGAITVSDVEIRLPVRESPGASGGQVHEPAPKILPAGAELAPGYGPEIRVAKAGDGDGTVTSSPAGIDCGVTCTAPFADGTSVTLTASPDGGSRFGGWTGGGCSGTGACVVSVDYARSITATFEHPPPGAQPTPPDTEITKARIRSRRRSATFRFSGAAGSAAVKGFRCAIDGGKFRHCRSPTRLRRLDRGRHRFAVAALDVDGRVDPSPARKRFRIKRSRR